MKKKLGIVFVIIFVCNLLPVAVLAKKSGGGSILGFDPGNCKEVSSEDGSSFTVCVTKNTPESELTRENFYQLQQAVKSLAINSNGKAVKKIPADMNFACAQTTVPPTMPPPATIDPCAGDVGKSNPMCSNYDPCYGPMGMMNPMCPGYVPPPDPCAGDPGKSNPMCSNYDPCYGPSAMMNPMCPGYMPPAYY